MANTTTLPPILTVHTTAGPRQISAISRSFLKHSLNELHYVGLIDGREEERVFEVYDDVMRQREKGAEVA